MSTPHLDCSAEPSLRRESEAKLEGSRAQGIFSEIYAVLIDTFGQC